MIMINITRKRQAKWTGHVLRRDSLLRDTIEDLVKDQVAENTRLDDE